MASSVFFRFKSQKEPTRVAFDGTGISVFELKREIILLNRLGDGTDFELVISAEDTGEEYDDDTQSIPRSMTVIAKRLPALKPGRGGAARYVSGKMPQNAKTSHRGDASTLNSASTTKKAEPAHRLSEMNGAQTEEEKIAAMFKLGADQWAQQQQEMANATPVYRSGPLKSKQVNAPDRPPPQGYVCYRCGEKGHWIQACPTNDDPAYVNRPRVKRTTGIPRSFLKTVDKPTAAANDGTVDETKQPTGVMINADGEWVIAEPDKASWDQYQARAKVSAAAQEAAARGSKALQERGLECSIDKRLFVEPSRTPCCETTYCLECITNALLENDLRCPQCNTENILLDDLKPDEQMVERIRAYEHEQHSSQSPEASKSPRECGSDLKSAATNKIAAERQVSGSPKSRATALGTPDSTRTASVITKGNGSRKRPADSLLETARTPPPPGTEATKQGGSQITSSGGATPAMSTTAGDFGLNPNMGSMGMPAFNPFMNMPMNMMAPAPMGMGSFNPMTMMNPRMAGNGSNNWNGMWHSGFPQQPYSMGAGAFLNGVSNGQFGGQDMQMPSDNEYANSYGMNGNGTGRSNFSNQQRNHFAGSKANEEDSPYFRRPVNPHRHQARRNVNRPADYREI
ncbi:MAG: hypothetical protein LQ348_001617 [Seirophora lacunosa]|nr:MAG: hypothetical protein LQ348_001617 [Seirophora lacunosa]